VAISYYPLNEKQLMQAPGETDTAIRSYYENFNTASQMGVESTFQIAVEYKKPRVSLNGNRQVKIDWYNLLLMASIKINKDTRNCENSYLGFVELVEIDTAWYKKNSGVDIRSEQSLANPERQCVMTKLSNRSSIFATDKSRTIEYERLIKKKIFLVHTDHQYNVLEVITGIDVMMYLQYHTDSIAQDGRVNLTLKKDHSLFQRVINPEKYVSILNDNDNQQFRDMHLTNTEWFQSRPDDASLDPLPKNINTVTL